MDSEECDEADLIPKNCARQPVFSFSFCNLDCFSEQGLQVDLLDRVFPLPFNLQPFYQVSNLLQIREMVKFSVSLMINRLLAFIILYPYIWSLQLPSPRKLFSLISIQISPPILYIILCFRTPSQSSLLWKRVVFFKVGCRSHFFFFFFYKEIPIVFLAFCNVSIPDGQSLACDSWHTNFILATLSTLLQFLSHLKQLITSKDCLRLEEPLVKGRFCNGNLKFQFCEF